MLLDEVHVVPAAMFRKVIGITKAHCKLGLTATLVREDEKVEHLNFLIGPKLYEANWLDLQRDGHIANVQCVEVWCPMTAEFYKKYLSNDLAAKRQILYCMNPNKFMTCQYLMQFHEKQRKDKIIIFSDNIYALREYATVLRRPLIYGETSHAERTRVLHAFKFSDEVNTIFLSKVGDNSIDIPKQTLSYKYLRMEARVDRRHSDSAESSAPSVSQRRQVYWKGTAGVGEHNAFFYSLVSTDTEEMYFSTKLQQFLVQQGYAFKVVANIFDESAKHQLLFHTREDQMALLERVLRLDEVTAVDEALVEDDDDITCIDIVSDTAKRREDRFLLSLELVERIWSTTRWTLEGIIDSRKPNTISFIFSSDCKVRRCKADDMIRQQIESYDNYHNIRRGDERRTGVT